MKTEKAKKAKKGFLDYVGLISVVAAIALAVVGYFTKGFANQTFDMNVIYLLGIGVLFALLAFATRLRLAPLLASIAFSLAYGLVFYDGAPIIADYFNDLNFMNGNSTYVVIYVILGGVCCLASILTCFSNKKLK
jgi:hypothetical protein